MLIRLRVLSGILAVLVFAARLTAEPPAPTTPPTAVQPATAAPQPTHEQNPAVAVPAGASDVVYPYDGTISGDDVYVRSGPGTNWYPTTKLARGTQVKVYGEEYGWLKIVPPQGSFSYVDAAAIQRSADGKTGTTTLDGVYVKAGSSLSDRKIASQQILPKGAEVTILGEVDGFLKIVPPSGSYLFVSKLYVKEGAGSVAANTDTPPTTPANHTTAAMDNSTPTAPPVKIADRARNERAPRTNQSGPAATKYRTMLDAVEAELRGLLATQSDSSAYLALIDRYKPLTEQNDDPVTREIARARIEQLGAWNNLYKIVDDAHTTTVTVDAFREQLEIDREKIKNSKLPPEMRAWDYKGELRRSMAFPDRENRYRLIDPVTRETVAYVDILPTSGIDPARLVNRYIGVRVSSQTFSASAKCAILVASEADLLARPGTMPQEKSADGGSRQSIGSPAGSPRPLMATPPAQTEPIQNDDATETTTPDSAPPEDATDDPQAAPSGGR